MFAILMVANLVAVVLFRSALGEHEHREPILWFLLVQEAINVGICCIGGLSWTDPLPHIATIGTIFVIAFPGYGWMPSFGIAAVYYTDLIWYSLWRTN